MTNEYKNKILDTYVSKKKFELCDIFGSVYYALILEHTNDRLVILVEWHSQFQILTKTNIFNGALSKTFYRDTTQIDDLIRIINSYKRNK